ncbi:MAG: TRAP transporter substrate-binding protein [Burkholderiales bacterium]|nr:TRAP transporter substrate-binding protein [Burkholderiales bacterium]
MKYTHHAARFAVATGVALSLSLPLAAQEITLKVAHFWAPGAMAPTKVIQPWCDKINKDSGGKLKCQIYPAMQLGGTPAQLFDQARDGVADIVYTLPGYTAGRFPLAEVFELPFMNLNAEASSQAVWEYYLTTPAVQKEFAGVKPLMMHTHDEGYVHTKEKQIKSLADFKGLKMRAPTRQTNKLLAKLGATPVAMPLPQVPEALSKGVIDGYLLPWEVIPSLKLHELTKFHSETDAKERALYSAVFLMAMNPAKYDSLPADLKKVIDSNSGAALVKQTGRTWDDSATAGRKSAEERKNGFYTVPAAELANWRNASASLYDEWVADVTAKANDGKALLAKAQALVKKYEK